jgi:hypothetical protein
LLEGKALVTATDRTPTTDLVTPPWQDPTLPVADRVELLLAEMTLEEKVAQLGSRWVGNDMQDAADGDQESTRDHEADLNVAPMQDVFAAAGAPTLAEASRHRGRARRNWCGSSRSSLRPHACASRPSSTRSA